MPLLRESNLAESCRVAWVQEITNNRQDRTVFKRLTDPANGLPFPVSILLLFGGVVLKPLSSGSRFQENGIYRKTRID